MTLLQMKRFISPKLFHVQVCHFVTQYVCDGGLCMCQKLCALNKTTDSIKKHEYVDSC